MFRLVVIFVVGGLAVATGRGQEIAPPEQGPFLVYMGSFSTKQAAQNYSAEFGGWTLRTDLYSGLTPGFYAAVIGPFRLRADAEAALRQVLSIQPDAIVRSAGSSILPPALGDPALLAAVLGDLTVLVDNDSTVTNPCAPDEPYVTILVGFASPILGEENAPIGGFWIVERTGEVIPIRACGG